MSAGKRLHLRLFLEGEEVPVISAQVSVNLGAPAVAAIQIVPLDSALDLLPRTMVHLFFLDEPTDGEDLGKYRLLFAGELMSFAYSQTPASRGLVIQCMDFSNYWDSANVMSIAYGPGGNAFTNDGSVNGAAIGTFTDIPGDSAAEHLVRWIQSTPVTQGLTNVSGLAGGIIRVMEAMGGVPGHFKGINDFYTVAELRCRLLNQITAEEHDSTAARVLSISVFMEWLKNGIQQAGGNVSFRDVMRILFGHIYYEFVANPTAKFDDGTSSQTSSSSTTALTSNLKVAGIRARLDEMRQTLILLNGQMTVMATDILVTTVGGLVTILSTILSDLTAIGATPSDLLKARSSVQQALGSLNQLKSANESSIRSRLDTLPAAWKAIIDAIAFLDGGSVTSKTLSKSFRSQRLHSQIIRPDCWFASPPKCNVIFPETYASITYDRNYLQETTRLLVHSFNSLIGMDHLMATHILAPMNGFDSTKLMEFHGASSFRVLMDHEIHVGIVPKTEWIPNTANMGQSLDAEQAKKVKNGRLSWMTKASLFHFFKYRYQARQVSVAGRFNPFVVAGFPGAVITRPYYVKGTVSEGDINDKADAFNAPNHFLGMVGAIQHSVGQDGGTTNVVLHHARKHRGVDDAFIGLMETNKEATTRTVNYSIDVYEAMVAAEADKGTKPLALILGVTPKNITPNTPQAAAARPVSTSSATSSQPVKRASRQAGSADSVVGDVSYSATVSKEQDAKQTVNPANTAPAGTMWGSIPGLEEKVWVPKGSTAIKVNEKKGLFGGKIVGIQVNEADLQDVSYQTAGRITQYGTTTPVAGIKTYSFKTGTKPGTITVQGKAFQKVTIYEEVPVSVSGSIPIEEVLRPSWFSTAYANQNIGKSIYQPFFGCDSTVDGLVSASAASSGVNADPAPPDPFDVAASLKSITIAETQKRQVSLEKALNLLGYEYGRVKGDSFGVDDFVRNYTYRPIATLKEILGDADLDFDLSTAQVGGDVQLSKTSPGKFIGFHTGATNAVLSKAGQLIGLSSDLQLHFTRINGVGASEPLVQKYDVRPAKHAKVRTYVLGLSKGPGFVG